MILDPKNDLLLNNTDVQLAHCNYVIAKAKEDAAERIGVTLEELELLMDLNGKTRETQMLETLIESTK